MEIRATEGERLKSWVITGCSRGLGRAVAEAALRRGDRVVATARKPDSLADLAEQYGALVRVLELDAMDPAAAVEAVRVARQEFGSLDVVLPNAGYANSAAIEDTSEEDFMRQISTNFLGMVRLVKAALPAMREQAAGHFLQMSSISGRAGGTPGLAPYYSTKFAIEGFSEVLRAEVEPLGLKVTILEPGAFRTGFIGSATATPPSSAGYATTVGARQHQRLIDAAKQPGDPVRAAKVIVDIAHLASPPFRVLLGSDAVRWARLDGLKRLLEIDEWEQLSRSTDFPTESI